MHELAHWTGHPDRLNRLKGFPFGSPDYAREELRAELAGLFIAAEKDLPFEPQNSAAYMKTWIKPLKDDKNEIFLAAADADRSASYVDALDRGEIPQVKNWRQMEEERRQQRAANERTI